MIYNQEQNDLNQKELINIIQQLEANQNSLLVQKTVQIGKYKFVNIITQLISQNSSHARQNRLNFGRLEEQIKVKLNSLELEISDNQYVVKNWNQLFFYMTQTFIQKLRILHNMNPKVIEQIYQVKFTNLKFLSLKANLIHNIEAIELINVPFLQNLDLHYNKIVNFNPLSKTSFKCLKNLDLSFNKCKSSTICLSRMKSSYKMQVLHSPDSFSQTSSEDVSYLLILQSVKIKRATLLSDKRIKQIKVMNMVNSKYQLDLIDRNPIQKRIQDVIESVQYQFF